MANKSKGEGDADRGAVDREAVEAEAVNGATDKAAAADPNAEDATVLSETGPTPSQAAESAEEAEREAQQDAGRETARFDDLADDPAPEQTPPPAEPAAQSSGAFSAVLYGLLGALIGGAISLTGADIMRDEGVPQSEIATKTLLTSVLDERLSDLEQTLRAELDKTVAQNAALKAELAGYEADRVAASAEAADARAALKTTDTQIKDEVAVERSRVTKLTAELVALERERAAAVSAMREQVSSLAAAVTATPSGGLVGGGSADDGPTSAGATARLALLEGGLRRIEARVNGLSSEALPTPDLTRIDKLETADRETDARLVALTERLDSVERRSRSAVNGDAAVGVAFAGLAEAVAGSSPYAGQLATLRKVAELTEIDPALSGPAEVGLLSVAALSSRFDAAATQGLKAAAKDRAAKGEGGVADRLSGLFTLRRVAEPDAEAMDDSAILARAKARIGEGDAAAAVAELDAMPTAARAAMADWIRAAERRAKAEAALAALRAQLLGID